MAPGSKYREHYTGACAVIPFQPLGLPSARIDRVESPTPLAHTSDAAYSVHGCAAGQTPLMFHSSLLTILTFFTSLALYCGCQAFKLKPLRPASRAGHLAEGRL
jgi:hypothetical protein